MTSADMATVAAVSTIVHPAFPEDAAVFAERLRLYPRGCHVLTHDGAIEGYVLSHPWHDGAPPALNTLLHALPTAPTTYYIHDLALLPDARGSGASNAIVGALIKQAIQIGLPTLSLIAVNNSQGFWQRHGFQPVAATAFGDKLKSYGADAQFMRRDVATAN